MNSLFVNQLASPLYKFICVYYIFINPYVKKFMIFLK